MKSWSICGVLFVGILTSCGLRPGSGGINEGLPSHWVALASAPLVALGGYDVSGQATLYKDPGTNQISVRLESLTTPGGVTLYLTASYAGGSPFGSTYIALHGHTGNQNYSTNVVSSNPAGWVSVSIVSLSTGTSVTYGTASFNK